MDASLEHEGVADYSFDNQAPSMDSSYFAVEVSAWDEHLDNVVVACMDWARFAFHDENEVAHDSSFHFDTLQ